MNMQLDQEVNALDVRVVPGQVHRTVEVEEAVNVDLDDEGKPLGVEFVDADDGIPFRHRHNGEVTISVSRFGAGTAARA